MRDDDRVTPNQPRTPKTAQQRGVDGDVGPLASGAGSIGGGARRSRLHSVGVRSRAGVGYLAALGGATLVLGISGLGVDGDRVSLGSASAAAGDFLAKGAPLAAPRLAFGTALAATTDPLLDGDYDDDGLSDEQEELIGTQAWTADSDSDGFDDAEEIARGSNPLDMFSVPTTVRPSAGLLAHGRGGDLRLVLVVHEPSSYQGDALVRIGLQAGGDVLNVPISRLMPNGTTTLHTGSNGSSVQVIDVPLAPSLVHAHGHVTFFAASGSLSEQTLSSATKVDLHSDGSYVYFQATLGPQSQKDQGRYGGETIREPIPLDDGLPPTATFIAGAVCFQRSEVVGVNGSRMLHQVVEADCVPGWDSFCSTDCSAALGTTYETIDPWALIGG